MKSSGGESGKGGPVKRAREGEQGRSVRFDETLVKKKKKNARQKKVQSTKNRGGSEYRAHELSATKVGGDHRAGIGKKGHKLNAEKGDTHKTTFSNVSIEVAGKVKKRGRFKKVQRGKCCGQNRKEGKVMAGEPSPNETVRVPKL